MHSAHLVKMESTLAVPLATLLAVFILVLLTLLAEFQPHCTAHRSVHDLSPLGSRIRDILRCSTMQ